MTEHAIIPFTSTPSAVLCAIGLGANLGDRAATIRAALDVLDAHEHIAVVAQSTLIETDAVGPGDQPRYLNGAALLRTELGPGALLACLLATERSFGRDRDRETRWGPRTLDIDLLLYGDMSINAPGLQVPHPRMLERAFVLEPLAEIGAGLMVPSSERGSIRVDHALRSMRSERLCGETP